MRRRDFCRQLALTGGAVVLAPLLQSCAPSATPQPTRATLVRPTDTPGPTVTLIADRPRATPTPQPSPTESPVPTPIIADETPQPASTVSSAMATVALVKTTDRAHGVRAALALLGHNPVRGNRVLLKPNYNSADPAPASTHPDTLRALVTELSDHGARAITLGERSGMGVTRSVLNRTGVTQMAEELGFDTLVFDELAESDWTVHQVSDSHWQAGFAVPRALLDSECVVQTCNLKTHGYGGHFTLSLKNSVGFVARTVDAGGYNYMEELHDSPYQRQLIAEINAAYAPALIVLDGVEAFVDGGPATGSKVSPSVVVAGTDRVAIDAVGVAILRLFGTTPQVSEGRVFEQAQIARAVELGLGIDAPERIQFVTGDAESAEYAQLIGRFVT